MNRAKLRCIALKALIHALVVVIGVLVRSWIGFRPLKDPIALLIAFGIVRIAPTRGKL